MQRSEAFVAPGSRRRIGDILAGQGVLTPGDLRTALEQQVAEGRRRRLGSILVEWRLATEDVVARGLAEQLGLPYVDLSAVPVDPVLTRLVPSVIARRHQLVPIARVPGGIQVAMADATNVLAVDDVRLFTGLGVVRPSVATASAVAEAIARFYGLGAGGADLAGVVAPPEPEEEPLRIEIDAGPVVRMVSMVFEEAMRARATDVHMEPQSGDLRVRYRVDGMLREVMSIPKSLEAAVVSRIKLLSGLDIAERRLPQDGRTTLVLEGAEADLRVSTMPTLFGEKVVVRLLPLAASVIEVSSLGAEPEQERVILEALSASQGLVVFTGPTGSGKTTSLYAGLGHLLSPERNIVTIEDPIEYQLPGLNQVQIDERTGITFARTLRTVLRQDPNVIMVGEIRDLETAQIVMQASLTGHLVLSTMHTNDAASAVTRLVDIGVEPYVVSSALTLIVGQRLLRRVCDRCRISANPSESAMELLGVTPGDLAGFRVSEGAGCERCRRTGYHGRTAVYEVMPVSPELRRLIAAGAPERELEREARAAGAERLRDAALRKVCAGETTLEEVLRAAPRAQRATCPESLVTATGIAPRGEERQNPGDEAACARVSAPAPAPAPAPEPAAPPEPECVEVAWSRLAPAVSRQPLPRGVLDVLVAVSAARSRTCQRCKASFETWRNACPGCGSIGAPESPRPAATLDIAPRGTATNRCAAGVSAPSLSARSATDRVREPLRRTGCSSVRSRVWVLEWLTPQEIRGRAPTSPRGTDAGPLAPLRPTLQPRATGERRVVAP